MSVGLDAAELERFLAESITGTVVTINPDGTPLPTPVWYVNRGPEIYFRTMRSSQKAKNIARDPRVAVQVEAGHRYLELKAVIINGTAEEANDPELKAWYKAERGRKYDHLAPSMKAMPAATQKHYSDPFVLYRVVPAKVKSWDNAKIRVSGKA
jgi:PPOX class probable F420-dependent enzyme